MRVAHIGNVANIAYLNTKFLRRKGIEADVYIHSAGTTCVSCPEWEEGDFVAGVVPLTDPDWSKVPMKNGWERPSWVKDVPPLTWHRFPYAKVDPFIEQMEYKLNAALKYRQHQIVNASLKRRGLPELDFSESSRCFDIYRWEKMVSGYDLVVAYGAEPVHCLIDYPGKPYIAVDYGSPLRDMIFGRLSPYPPGLLRAAFEYANYVVLTNPDVRDAAEQLGVQYVFIPHPIDETKYCPGPSQIREELEAKYGQEVIVLFAPARHDWAIKGNDKMIRACARIAREHSGPLVLVLVSWGQEITKSKELLRTEGLEDKTIWLPMLPKVQMLAYYRAADIVLDQFNIGTFGLTAPEAMACAKPVVLHFDLTIHSWCFEEMPPVVEAHTEEEIYLQLRKLVNDPVLRQQIGKSSREWVTRYHGWERVADAHIALYKAVLKR